VIPDQVCAVCCSNFYWQHELPEQRNEIKVHKSTITFLGYKEEYLGGFLSSPSKNPDDGCLSPTGSNLCPRVAACRGNSFEPVIVIASNLSTTCSSKGHLVFKVWKKA